MKKVGRSRRDGIGREQEAGNAPSTIAVLNPRRIHVKSFLETISSRPAWKLRLIEIEMKLIKILHPSLPLALLVPKINTSEIPDRELSPEYGEPENTKFQGKQHSDNGICIVQFVINSSG